MNKNFYEILQISENATLEEIKKAYRKLALQFHPDKNKGKEAHSRFIEINIAYETLKDIDSRNVYDKSLKSEKSFNNYSNEKYEQKAKEYANMSYEQFENIIDNIIVVGKKIKKTASKGCGWIVAIIFFSLSAILFIGAFVGGNFSIIFLSLFLALLGLGGYSMAKGE